MSLYFAIRGYLEWPNIVIARTVCRPGDVIHDIGANIGTEALPLAEVVGSDGAAEGFELLPDNVLADRVATCRSRRRAPTSTAARCTG
ncbi:MAG TPA: hypothetical protein PKC49_12860 [Phycisphaerae bacterium]|nr:hypothetical protein [Phycisphaerae bacterium]